MMLRLRQLVLSQTRCFGSSTSKLSTEKSLEAKVEKLDQLKSGPLEDHGRFPGMPLHNPSKWDRMCLVWSGHYKTIGDVPNRVHNDTIHKSRTYARIRVNLGFMALGVGICLTMIYLGKRDAGFGITVEGQNLEWHRKMNEEHRRRQAAAADKS